jgi:hypothetical protein
MKFWVTFTYCGRTVDGKTHLSRSGEGKAAQYCGGPSIERIGERLW